MADATIHYTDTKNHGLEYIQPNGLYYCQATKYTSNVVQFNLKAVIIISGDF